MKILGLILPVVLITSAACSLPVLHRKLRVANPHSTSAKHAVIEHTADKPCLTKPLARDRASMGANRLRPDEERAFLEYARVSTQSTGISDKGDADAKQGDWAQAQEQYRQALAIWPDNSAALYGMGRCAEAAGDTASAINYYRTASYADNSPHSVYNTQTNDPVRLMEFALLLSEGGQEKESLSVYQRAAGLLNYVDGKPNLHVLLPDFRSGSWTYSPQRLRAMARVGIAVGPGNWDDKKALTELQEASTLAPDSPLPYFYEGRVLIGKGGRSRERNRTWKTYRRIEQPQRSSANKPGPPSRGRAFSV